MTLYLDPPWQRPDPTWLPEFDQAVKLWDERSPFPFALDEATVVVFRVGSHSHGTHVPLEDPNGIDDVDLMIIVIPPPQYRLGLKQFEHWSVQEGNLDVVVYEWGKWLNMLLKQNPNVVGTLWLEKEDIYPRAFLRGMTTAPFVELQELYVFRDRLLSKQMATSFMGYAMGQLHKMTHHVHQGYMGAKRKALVERYGYDVKNAAHLIRLLRMAVETLTTGKLVVRRPDAAELIKIKQGGWTLEQVQEEALRLFNQVKEAERTTALSQAPVASFVDAILVRGYRSWWAWC